MKNKIGIIEENIARVIGSVIGSINAERSQHRQNQQRYEIRKRYQNEDIRINSQSLSSYKIVSSLDEILELINKWK